MLLVFVVASLKLLETWAVARDGQREVEMEDGRWKMEDGGDLAKGPGAGSEFLQVAAIWASDPRAEMVSDRSRV